LPDSLPDDLCRFIDRDIHTLEQLEILRLLFNDPARRLIASVIDKNRSRQKKP
jgi:hypothetical protein